MTYTFYLLDDHGGREFEPRLCQSDLDAMAQARAVKDQRPDCAAVEVFFGETLIVRIETSR